MKKDKVQIPNRKRDFVIPFAKTLSLGVIAIGAISMLTSPVLGVTYVFGIVEMGLGLLGGVYCAAVDHLERKEQKRESQAVRKMVIEEYKEKEKEDQKVVENVNEQQITKKPKEREM